MIARDVTERIRRLLILVPEVVRAKEGVPVEDLAAKLGVGPEELPAQLERLMLVGKPPFNPDDLIELYIEDDRVHAVLHQSLDRPPRLTHDEALALAVGAECVRVGDEEGPARSAALESALAKIEGAMTPDERERYKLLAGRIALSQSTVSEPDVRSVLWRALERGQAVVMTYYSAHRDVMGEREVEPYGIFAHRGYWYLVAGPDGPDGYKLYRLDRIREARPTGEAGAVEMPKDLDLERLSPGGFGRGAGRAGGARIRLRGAKARLATQKLCEEQTTPLGDGSVEIRFDALVDDWISAFVLSMGGDAEILEPASLREKVLADARKTRARYG